MPDFLHIVSARHAGGYRLHLCFNDGAEGDVDVGAALDGPIFEPLRDLNVFRSFTLTGHTVAWPNGADFAPEFLHELLHAGAVAA